MAFQNSPNFEDQTINNKFSVREWISRHARLVLVIVGLFITLDIILAAFLLIPQQNTEPGGLDGCVISADGKPVSATVQVNNISKSTYEDGCFFFPSLPPGEHELTIQTAGGQTIMRSIIIVSREAVILGDIIIPP